MRNTVVVWKYTLPIEGETVIDMPRGAIVVSVQVQNDTPTLWAIVDPDERVTERRRFICVGTGHKFEIEDSQVCMRYLATLQVMGGRLVFHYFELHDIKVTGVKEVYFGEGK